VLQLLLKRGAGHRGKGITRASSRMRIHGETGLA
jgi:hypothetical protein